MAALPFGELLCAADYYNRQVKEQEQRAKEREAHARAGGKGPRYH